ncbi:GspH/FimT family pseudopilin [Gilvimarinus polysaccharolyticus]|uniref:GspH/FimT family pseudopilin n=1 Tax=Gilvimarinus polysaccharolyticus TaxID=863921 RepID=UPI000673A365|nr:GspH/FimT family pseudopilin [Gilvimarinus polysaccharolyticus]
MVAAPGAKLRGFTLLELLIVFSIAGLLLAVSVPASHKMYQSMQYREAVRDVRRALEAARYKAMISGQAAQVSINPREKRIGYGNGESRDLPDFVTLEVEAAQELMLDSDTAVIRFYSDGSSTGGTVNIGRNNRWVRLHVGWLLGRVEQSVDGQLESAL